MTRRVLLPILAAALATVIAGSAHAQPGSNVYETGLTFASPADLQKVRVANVPLMGVLPTSVDLSTNLPEPEDQGKQGSCVGFAVAYALKSYQEMVERQWSWSDATRFSAAYVYNHVKLPGSCNAGAFYPDALEFVKNNGAAPIAVFTYQDDSCSAQASQTQKNAALPFRIAEYERVNPGDSFEMRAHLAGGRPVLIGMKVDQGFMNLGQSIYQVFAGPALGGHAMAVVGYDDARGAYKVINSWGKSWGTAGYGWIAYGVFAPSLNIVLEAYVVKDLIANSLTLAPAPPPPPPAVTGVSRRLEVVQRRYESLGVRSETKKTGDHHCAADCAGEPTRTPYTLALTARPGRLLRDPKLVCEGAACPWSAISYVRLQDKGAAVEAGWSVWSRPTIWRLEAEEVQVEEYRREGRTAKPGDTLEIEAAADDAPPEVSVTVKGKQFRVGSSSNSPDAGVEYVGRQERDGKAVYTFRVVGGA